MSKIKDLFNRIFGYDDDDFFDDGEPFDELESEENEEMYHLDDTTKKATDSAKWDWDSVTRKRNYLRIGDELEREKYIKSVLEQVKDASGELDKLSYEYNSVTAYLKDMDEIDSLPDEQRTELQECAQRILYFEGERREFYEKKNRMSDSDFYHLEKFADQMPKAYNDIKDAEQYHNLVKNDLSKLDGEKQAGLYRRDELRRDIVNCKGMVMITLFAAVICVLMLLILQFGFEMETRIGYLLTVLGAAVAITVLYVRYQDQRKELERVERNINRMILLQNTVKIRYVNNTNLLDYLYLKYNTKSARDLKRKWEIYEEEVKAREINAKNEEELDFYQNELLKVLRRFQLSDPRAWVHQPQALMDHKEMVEIRHEYIIRRQKLRARMDYNKRLAKEGEKEIKEFSKDYPQYAKDVIRIMDRY